MGLELVCTARWGGKRVRGKALLEAAEIIFRGEDRLKIPFNSIKLVTTKDGELHVKTAEGVFLFDLGKKAEKWREKIANPKSVVEKLGVKEGDRVVVLGNLDAEFQKKLRGQESGVERRKFAADVKWIFLVVGTREELAELKKTARKMQGSMGLWVVYPKGQKSITEADVIGAGR